MGNADADLAPHLQLAQLSESEAHMCTVVAALAQTDLSAASALPGWSVAHVLTHLARNADSHVRRIDAARANEVIDQYPGGFAGREEEIARGAARPADEIVADVVATSQALDAAWPNVRGDEWLVESRDTNGTIRQVRTLPTRRLQEVEVHLIDLGIGCAQREWSDVLVSAYLPEMRATMAGRVPDGSAVPTASDLSTLDPRDELAWLYGRIHIALLPDLLPIGTMNAGPGRA